MTFQQNQDIINHYSTKQTGQSPLGQIVVAYLSVCQQITISYVGVGQFKPLASSHMAD